MMSFFVDREPGLNIVALVAGLVVGFVCIVAVTFGVTCYFYQHRKKPPVAQELSQPRGSSQQAEANVYVESPTETPPHTSGIMRTSSLSL